MRKPPNSTLRWESRAAGARGHAKGARAFTSPGEGSPALRLFGDSPKPLLQGRSFAPPEKRLRSG